jgi:hypothetical protein
MFWEGPIATRGADAPSVRHVERGRLSTTTAKDKTAIVGIGHAHTKAAAGYSDFIYRTAALA